MIEPFCHHFCNYFPKRNCHQKPDFLAKVHQSQFRPRVGSKLRWKSSPCSPIPLSRLGRGTPLPLTFLPSTLSADFPPLYSTI